MRGSKTERGLRRFREDSIFTVYNVQRTLNEKILRPLCIIRRYLVLRGMLLKSTEFLTESFGSFIGALVQGDEFFMIKVCWAGIVYLIFQWINLSHDYYEYVLISRKGSHRTKLPRNQWRLHKNYRCYQSIPKALQRKWPMQQMRYKLGCDNKIELELKIKKRMIWE